MWRSGGISANNYNTINKVYTFTNRIRISKDNINMSFIIIITMWLIVIIAEYGAKKNR